jgi:hypothetical protein
MGKKPQLSLRKPPAPVDLAAAERFVQTGDAETNAQTARHSNTQTAEAVLTPRAETAIHVAVARPLDPQTSRRPDVQRSEVPIAPARSLTPSRGLLARKDGRELRRMTIYLPSDLARRLAVLCAEQDMEMSDVVTRAVRQHIEG